MIGLTRPSALVARAHRLVQIGGLWALLSLLVMPGALLAQLGIAFVALGLQIHLQAVVRKQRALILELAASRIFSVASLPQRAGRWYLGIGFRWQSRHVQRLWDLCAQEAQEKNAYPMQDKGDPRIFGVGGLDASEISYPESDNNQHVGIFGGPGFGKSRLGELFIEQAVQAGAAVVIIDPKGDAGLRQRAQQAARHMQVTCRLFDLTNPSVSATYNPLSRFSDPAQLGSRYAALCPSAGAERFWTERAAATGQIVATAMDAVQQYLIALGADDRQPPQVLCRFQAAKPARDRQRDAALAGCDTDPDWLSSLSWTPRLSAGDQFGVDRPHQLLAAMLLVLHSHGPEAQGIDPQRIVRTEVPDLWALHQALLERHPCAQPPEEIDPLFAAMVSDLARARLAFVRVMAAAVGVHDICEQGLEYWQKINCSLPAALIRFRGERERIVCASIPDITWPRVYAQREVVYFSLGSMVDRQASEGLARIIVEDLAAYVGTRNAQGEAPLPIYFIVDEIASFITPTYIDLLNKSRSSGMRCVMIGQTVSDIEAALGSRAKAEQVLGNLNTIIQLRTPSQQDAMRFAKRSGTVRLLDITANRNESAAGGPSAALGKVAYTAGSGHGYGYKDHDQVPAHAVANLPIGQAFIIGMGFIALFAFPTIDPGPCCPHQSGAPVQRRVHTPPLPYWSGWDFLIFLVTAVLAGGCLLALLIYD